MELSWVGQLVPIEWVVWPVLAVVLTLGLIAIVSPRRFASVSRGGGRWIDTSRLVEQMDRRIDLDHLAIRHSRLFGLAIVTAVAVLAYVFYTVLLHRPLPF